MGEWGMLIPVVVALIGLYALRWARSDDVVQPKEGGQHLPADQGGVVAEDEAAATGDEVTEVGPAAGTEDDARP